MTKRSPISSEDVMNAFAMDFEPKTDILKQYLADYPQFAADLVDLARELSREIDEDLPLSVQELAAISAKMDRLRESTVTVETLQTASPKIFAAAAKALGLPIQVGVAIQSFLLLPAQVSSVRSNKSDDKPALAEKVPLERLLREAGMDEASISKQLLDDE